LEQHISASESMELVNPFSQKSLSPMPL
jgi:hypothetical protein